MKRTTLLWSTALIAVGGLALESSRRLAASRTEISELRLQIDGLSTEIQSPAPQPQMERELNALPKNSDGTFPHASEPEMRALTAPAHIGAAPSVASTLASSPEAQAKVRNLRRGMLTDRYPDIEAVLGLSAEQVSKLFDVLAQQQTEVMVEASAGPVSDPATGRVLIGGSRQKEHEAQLSALLGNKYSQWKQYNLELPVRREVQDLTVILESDGMSLNNSMKAPLVAALLAEQKRIAQDMYASALGGGGAGRLPSRYSAENVDARLRAASPYLNAQQLDEFRAYLERQKQRERPSQAL